MSQACGASSPGSGASAAAAPAELLSYLQEAAAGLDIALVGAPQDFYDLPRDGADPRPFGPGDHCYLQYSSGSTRAPLGVDVPQRVLMANSFAIINHGLQVRAGDRGFSWLPLYHDMGLVGFMLSPVLGRLSSTTSRPAISPAARCLWLKLMSENGGTLAYSPTFGYDLSRGPPGRARSRHRPAPWRIAGIGGDMVQPDMLKPSPRRSRPPGSARRAFLPSYGMAETTLAISFAPLDRRRGRRRRPAPASRAAPHRRAGIAGIARCPAGPAHSSPAAGRCPATKSS